MQSDNETREALWDLLRQLQAHGIYAPGHDEGQGDDASGLSFRLAETAVEGPDALAGLIDLANQLMGVGIYVPGIDAGQWGRLSSMSFARMEDAIVEGVRRLQPLSRAYSFQPETGAVYDDSDSGEPVASFNGRTEAECFLALPDLVAALLRFVDPDLDQPEGTTYYEDDDGVARCFYCHVESEYADREDGYVFECRNPDCPEKQARAALARLPKDAAAWHPRFEVVPRIMHARGLTG